MSGFVLVRFHLVRDAASVKTIPYLLCGLLLLPLPTLAAPRHRATFEAFTNCAYVATTYNDGDSFCVRVRDEDFVFRLYYVDTPESDTRFPERNQQQAAYFGITPEQSLQCGVTAREFVRDHLSGKTMTVRTRWALALGSSRLHRYYAIIEVDGEGLAETLVRRGLARLVGTTVNHPGGLKAADYLAKLQMLEDQARQAKAGAWALSDPARALAEAAEVETEPAPGVTWGTRLLWAGIGAALTGSVWWVTTARRRFALRSTLAQTTAITPQG